MQWLEIAWTPFIYAGIGFVTGVFPTFIAAYYVHKIECENRELKELLGRAGAKIEKFLDARRKGAYVTNSLRKK